MKKGMFFTLAFLCSMSVSNAGTFVASADDFYNTEDLQKISFVDDDVVVEFADGSVAYHEFSSLQRIYFNNSATNVPDALKNSEILIYPNPAVNEVCISGLPDNSVVSLISMTGALLHIDKTSGDVYCKDVTVLAEGIYFLKVNDEIIRFIKR